MAIKHLLPQVPKYFKTALHCHTNISDGGPTPEEMKELYKSHGYQVLSITDHNIIVDHSALNEENFLLLTGAEYNINEPGWAERRLWVKTYHLNFIAKRPDNLWQPFIPKAPKEESRHYLEKVTDGGFPWVYDLDNINAMIAEANRQGFLVMYNHPCWSLQTYPDYAGLKGLWGMEICNNDSSSGGFADRDNTHVYADLLNLGNDLVAVGADDAHGGKRVGGAWVMVGAKALTYEAVIDAMEKGQLYASTGPEIRELSLEDGILHIACSDAQAILVQTGTRFAKAVYPVAPDKLMREANINLAKWLAEVSGDEPQDWFRVIVRGPYGDYATTRAYRRKELI